MQPTDPFTVYSSPNSLAWYSFEGLPINEIRQDRHTLFLATLQLVRVGLWLLHGTVVLLTLLLLLLGDYVLLTLMPSVLWRCCVGGRKGIRPVKNWLAWFSVWREVQTCIWPSWCHCHSLSLALVKSRLVLPFWYRLTRVVPDKGPLNGCVCVTLMACMRPKVTTEWEVGSDTLWVHWYNWQATPTSRSAQNCVLVPTDLYTQYVMNHAIYALGDFETLSAKIVTFDFSTWQHGYYHIQVMFTMTFSLLYAFPCCYDKREHEQLNHVLLTCDTWQVLTTQIQQW